VGEEQDRVSPRVPIHNNKFGNVMILVDMLHDAEVEKQKQLCKHTYWSSCFLTRIYSFDDFLQNGLPIWKLL
jgi:hypothetical protein